MACQLACLVCFVALFGYSSSTDQTVIDGVSNGPRSERELREHLFRNYDKLVRPVKDAKEKITVSVAITPLRIRELDARDQTLVMETYVAFKWEDDYLKWNAKHFNNISALRVPSTEVWRPDLAIYGSPEQSQMFPEPATNAVIFESGTVMWVPMFTIRSKCPLVKSKKFVTCSIVMGSWTYSILSLDVQLTTKEVNLKNYMDLNPDWKLVHILSERKEKFYPCCVEAYPSLNFNVTLKRRTMNGVLPDGDTLTFEDVTKPVKKHWDTI